MNTKKLAFVVVMGALGNALFALSFYLAPIAPGIALDLSLLVVLVAGFFGGPKLGLATGIIAGVLPGIMFGPAGGGGLLGLLGLPLGKALTGLTSGFIGKAIDLQKPKRYLLGLPLSLLAYVPEAIFTIAYFTALMPIFLNNSYFVGNFVALYTIMVKAFVEVTIMGFVITALLRSKGFWSLIGAYFIKPNVSSVASQASVKSEA
jgi:riboflavin transporter FmnP